MDLFTNREIATGIWLAGFFGLALTNESTRQSLLSAFKSFLNPQIALLLALMALYTGLITWTLSEVGFWTTALVKDTVYWFVLTGVVVAFSMISKSRVDGIGRNLLADHFKLIVVLEVLVTSYTLSVGWELLLVGFIGFASLGAAQSDSSIPEQLLGVAGLFLLAVAVVQGISDDPVFGGLDTVRQVLLPVLLSITFIPMIAGLLLYSKYERLFTNLEAGPEKADDLRRYAKIQFLKRFGVNPKRVWAFLRTHGLDVVGLQSKEEVDRLLEEFDYEDSLKWIRETERELEQAREALPSPFE